MNEFEEWFNKYYSEEPLTYAQKAVIRGFFTSLTPMERERVVELLSSFKMFKELGGIDYLEQTEPNAGE